MVLNIYVGEPQRPLGVRFKQHTNLDRSTGMGEHCFNTGHSVSITNTTVIERELDWHWRKVKEAIHIRLRRLTINREQGYHPRHSYSADVWAISPPGYHYNYVIKACRSKSKRHKFQTTFVPVSTIYYYLISIYILSIYIYIYIYLNISIITSILNLYIPNIYTSICHLEVNDSYLNIDGATFTQATLWTQCLLGLATRMSAIIVIIMNFFWLE